MVNKTNINTNTKTQTKSHKLRTFFASIAGIIAVYLILSSVTVVWLNRTLTDTSTYVNTVAPLVQKPAIQNFIAEEVTKNLISNASGPDLASALLPPSVLAANPSQDQVKSLLTPVIQKNVLQIVQSPNFAVLWRQTNQTAHADIVNQLNSPNPNQINLDLSPAVDSVINDLKSTQLSPIAAKITVSPDTGKLVIKSNNLNRIHQYYTWFKEGTILVVVITIAMAGLSIWLSVHHAKTARRILMGTGILALLQALLLEAPAVVKLPGTDPTEQAAAKAFALALVHNLQIASLIIGVVFILAAVGSKLYAKSKH